MNCFKYHHIPKKYYGKYAFLSNKSLSEEIFDTESDAVAYTTKKKTRAAFMIRVGPNRPHARCYMVNPILSRCREFTDEGGSSFLAWDAIKVF